VKDVDRRVAGRASVIRQFYDDRVYHPNGEVKSGRIIGMGDAIHLATALQYDVLDFQTLDGSGKKARKFNLLALDGSVAGARLNIKMPKYIPPPVFSEAPIVSTTGGRQLSLLDALAEDRSRVMQQIAVLLKLACQQGKFRPQGGASHEA
jgi:hypothetical protein